MNAVADSPIEHVVAMFREPKTLAAATTTQTGILHRDPLQYRKAPVSAHLNVTFKVPQAVLQRLADSDRSPPQPQIPINYKKTSDTWYVPFKQKRVVSYEHHSFPRKKNPAEHISMHSLLCAMRHKIRQQE